MKISSLFLRQCLPWSGLSLAGSILLLSLSSGLHAQAQRAREISVVSFNIRYGTADDGKDRWELRKPLVARAIREMAPDLLGVQEALRLQLDWLREQFPSLDEIGVGRTDGREEGEFSSILYRRDLFRPIDSGTFWLSETPQRPGSKSWGNEIPRICTWALFEIRESGQLIYLFNTHFDHRSQPSREEGAKLLAHRIAQRVFSAPVIVTGDFNAGEENRAIRYLKSGNSRRVRLIDSFRVLHPDAREVGTFNGFQGRSEGEKIDYVMVSPDLVVTDAAIVRKSYDGRYPSDHYPVAASFLLPPD